MIILDAHQDIAYNALGFDRDYRISALRHREREAEKGWITPTIGLPDSILGRVALVFSTLFTAPSGSINWKLPHHLPAYSTPQEAYKEALKQMDYYQRLTDEDDRVRLIHTQKDLDAVLATWGEGTESGDHKQGLVVLMENADPIIEPEQFEEWFERGVRVVGPAWTASRYAGGTGAPGGLTNLGRDLLDVMADYGAILDVSHLAEQAFYEALDHYDGAIIASHSNPRRFCNTDRHLSDDMIGHLAERDGVMGVVLANSFLKQGWSRGDDPLPLSIVLDVIDHICQVTGSADHVGIGSDFDGGFGAESVPESFDTSGDLLTIADGLRERGYDEDDIDNIMSGNMLRKLREGLPV